MNKKLLTKYASLKAKEKEVAAEIKELQPKILEELLAVGDKVVFDAGTLSISYRKTWAFSPAVKDAEASVEVLKLKEQADGTATYKEKPELRFYPPVVTDEKEV